MDESIQHIFFDCLDLFGELYNFFNMTPPLNTHHMFNGWMQEVNKKLKCKILVGTCTLCWAMWISQNDVFFVRKNYVVFDKVRVFNPMQVIF
jgi:hypothetical protein